VGGELTLVSPPEVAAKADIAANSQVDISLENGAVVVRPVSIRKYALQDLLGGVTPENRHSETDWGPPVGQESW
jgi:antitoxin MazE